MSMLLMLPPAALGCAAQTFLAMVQDRATSMEGPGEKDGPIVIKSSYLMTSNDGLEFIEPYHPELPRSS